MKRPRGLKVVGAAGGDPRRSESRRLENLARMWQQRVPALLAISGKSVGSMYLLEQPSMTVGRDQICQISFPGEAISRRHARLDQDPDHNVTVTDLNSTNGTFVNGAPIVEHLLRDGDKIQIGDAIIFRFEYHDSAEAAERSRRYEAGARDPLTGVFNATHFRARLRDEFVYSTRQYESMSLLLADVDGLRDINERFVLETGDAVLRGVAEVLSRNLREEDILARHDRCDFAMLLRRQNEQRAYELAERLRAAVKALRIEWEGAEVPVTVSLGLSSLLLRNYEDARDMFNDAERYLYEAKHGGRDRTASSLQVSAAT